MTSLKNPKTKKVKTESWPKVNIGTHLTVIQYEDGKDELIWDDDKLTEEVKAAIASVESKSKKK